MDDYSAGLLSILQLVAFIAFFRWVKQQYTVQDCCPILGRDEEIIRFLLACFSIMMHAFVEQF
jgi:hypothetical protein